MPSEDRERDWQLGKVHRKVDAMERMRGVARYTDDLKLPGMLHAKILRSPHAHARIKSIDVAPALALPGVFAAVTGQDFKIPYGIIPWTPDENALAVDKVCHVGDGVVAVAAIDEDTANAAYSHRHAKKAKAGTMFIRSSCPILSFLCKARSKTRIRTKELQARK